jgi:hypothetical protein
VLLISRRMPARSPSAASRDSSGMVAVTSETVMIACGTCVTRNAFW